MRLYKLTLSLALTTLLVACGNDTPAPQTPATPVAQPSVVEPAPVDPAELERKRLEETQARVLAVSQVLATKHSELSQLSPVINEVKLGEPENPEIGGMYFYEVISPQGVFYTDNQVNFILLGNLLLGDEKNIQNFTQRPAVQQALLAMQEKEAQVGGSDIFKDIMLQPGLSFVYGTGENQIVVFEDPDCPMCQRLHKNLEEFGERLNISVKSFPFVLTEAHPNGVARAKMLLCAQDPTSTWKNWMLHAEGKQDMDALWVDFAKQNNLTDASCPRAAVVDQWQTVGTQLGLSATPSIMFQTGMLAEGSMTEESFKEAFEMVQKQLTALPAQAQAPALPQVNQPVVPPAPQTVDSSALGAPQSAQPQAPTQPQP